MIKPLLAGASLAVLLCAHAIAAEPPASRPFAMAINTLPSDFTIEAILETYDFVGEHADLVAYHIDKGVPWPEALSGDEFHHRVTLDLDFRESRTGGKTVFLSVSALHADRDRLNGYWAEEDRGERPGEWRTRSFDDPDVFEAYIAWCDHLIGRFDPAYMVYGIEANMLAVKTPELFDDYVRMSEQVYDALKARHPDLSLSLSFQLETFADGGAAQRDAVRRLMPYSDTVAISAYPYLNLTPATFGARFTDPDRLPEDWIEQLRIAAPDKPLIIAETGFPAESFDLAGHHFTGTEAAQADYVKWLLGEAQALDAQAVVWFVPRDYDAFWQKLPQGFIRDVFQIFRDTGLVNQAGNERLSLEVWEDWRALPIE